MLLTRTPLKYEFTKIKKTYHFEFIFTSAGSGVLSKASLYLLFPYRCLRVLHLSFFVVVPALFLYRFLNKITNKPYKNCTLHHTLLYAINLFRVAALFACSGYPLKTRAWPDLPVQSSWKLYWWRRQLSKTKAKKKLQQLSSSSTHYSNQQIKNQQSLPMEFLPCSISFFVIFPSLSSCNFFPFFRLFLAPLSS